jgi:predicted HicB family RNase H-like nuclease
MEESMQAILELMTRKRKTVTIRIDSLVWDAIESAAASQGISASRWLERFTFDSLKNVGLISSTENYLGETRGGDRKSNK